jgi:hypothetical protein
MKVITLKIIPVPYFSVLCSMIVAVQTFRMKFYAETSRMVINIGKEWNFSSDHL